ncbi:MAG TPA: hypothetical protein PLN85_02620 [archaeon]|nr:hypothetical protein [archaeon]
MSRLTKDLPKLFQKIQIEYTKSINIYWGSRRDTNKNKIESPENLGVLFLKQKELLDFIEKEYSNTGESIFQWMKNNNTDKMYLYNYGKVISLDIDTGWMFVRDINDKEWEDYDLKCSKEYVASKKIKN